MKVLDITKIGTDGKTRILDLTPPDGMTQAEYDRALTQHQRERDERNSQSGRLCGGLEVPYVQTSAPEPDSSAPSGQEPSDSAPFVPRRCLSLSLNHWLDSLPPEERDALLSKTSRRPPPD